MTRAVVPAPRDAPLAALYETIRYEHGAWPLWRLDRDLRYIAKSLRHRTTPWTWRDHAAWQASLDYLASGRWKRPLARAVRLAMGGDLMWIRDGWSRAMSPDVCAILDRADAALVNLETPVVPERPVPRLVYETLHYNAPPSYLDAWRSPRPRVVSLCNNHALDQGPGGLARSREVVASLGLVPLGGGAPEHAIGSFVSNGLRVGATAFTYGINHLAGAPPAGVPVVRLGHPHAPPDWDALAALLARARRAGPDLVAVVAHWGHEYEYWPGALAREHAARLVALGADVVVGSSPHVLQPVEVVSVDGADPRCPLQATRGGAPGFALIAWSLGNLCSIMPTLPCRVGALLEAVVGLDSGGAVALSSLAATPTVCGRGLGDGWFDARTLTLDEYARTHPSHAHRAHAARTLGPVLATEVP